MRMSKGRGLSSVVGGLIILIVIFSVLIPLLLYINRSTAIVHVEMLSRYNKELEKFEENLEAYSTICMLGGSEYLCIYVANNGFFAANISAVYVYDPESGAPTIYTTLGGNKILLSPHQESILTLSPIAAGEELSVKLATSRGRVLTPPNNRLSLAEPYAPLAITLKNLVTGRKYEITLTVKDAIDYVGNTVKFGCIPDAGGCIETTSTSFINRINNENRTVIFVLFPGNYTVRVVEYQWIGGSWTQTDSQEADIYLQRLSEAVFSFSGTSGGIPPSSAFELGISGPQFVEAGSSFDILLFLRYRMTASEAARDVDINLSVSDPACSFIYGSPTTSLDVLLQGITEMIRYTLVCPNDGDVTITATVTFTGENTGNQYGPFNLSWFVTID